MLVLKFSTWKEAKGDALERKSCEHSLRQQADRIRFSYRSVPLIFGPRRHQPTCVGRFGNNAAVSHCLRQWSGCRSIIFPSEQSPCQVGEQTVYFSATVHCCSSLVFQTALLGAAWFLLSLSDALPSLWTWRRHGVSHCKQHKTPFEILYEQPGLDWGLAFVEKTIQIAFPTNCKRGLNTICKKEKKKYISRVLLLSRFPQTNMDYGWHGCLWPDVTR